MDSQKEIVASSTQGTGASTLSAGGTPYVQAKSLSIGYSSEVVVPDINFELRQGEAISNLHAQSIS